MVRDDIVEEKKDDPEHEEISPVWHVLKGTARGLVTGYFVKSAFTFGLSLFSSKTYNIDTLLSIFGKDSVRFGCFIGVMNFAFKSMLLAMRKLRQKDDAVNYAIAGAVSGLSILLDTPDRRATIALYLFARGLHELFSLLISQNKLPDFKHSTVLAFALCQVPIMYTFTFEPDCLAPPYLKFITHVGNSPPNVSRDVFQQPSPPHGPFIPCHPLVHEGTCAGAIARYLPVGFERAARIYLPVHLLPSLIFQYKQAWAHPMTFTKKVLTRIGVSSAFLAVYTSLMRGTVCAMRNLMQKDQGWHACLGGLLAGSSLFIEYRSRHLELVLFCIPRSMEVIFNLLSKHHPWFTQYLFSIYIMLACLGMSLFHYCHKTSPANMRSVNRSVLEFIVGSRN
eukprot:TRINITY_DN5345_c0_g1_i12.p1 TRINITY_DN5345_c0_g1~~TRINITY_DN5345_c0_g1_i12.p1  ORF type:complete len:394 (-),score=47.22 TRINITY_DN5345_c0_g1_i12:143-1324(-)